MITYFTSDLHINHGNVLKFDNSYRPFSDVEEMNESILEQINSIGSDNRLIVIGDFSFHRKVDELEEYLKRINTRVELVLGNHDDLIVKNPHLHKYFHRIDSMRYESFMHEGVRYRIHMLHYPMLEWRNSHNGSMHVYGHLHGTPNILDEYRAMDVGYDPNKGKFLTSTDIIEKLRFRKIKDHHGK